MPKRLRAALSTLLIAIALDAYSQDSARPYDVELVLFKRVNATPTQEDWAYEAAQADASNDIGAAASPAPAANMTPPPLSVPLDPPFPLLAATSLQLTAVAEKLRKNSAYEVIAHFGWTQQASPSDAPQALDLAAYLPKDANLSGTVTLTRGKAALHLACALTLQAPDAHRYVLRQSAAIARGGKLYYFDHPYFGAIVAVNQSGKN